MELSDLITEYFVSDSHPDQEWSDDDFQLESDAEQVARHTEWRAMVKMDHLSMLMKCEVRVTSVTIWRLMLHLTTEGC